MAEQYHKAGRMQGMCQICGLLLHREGRCAYFGPPVALLWKARKVKGPGKVRAHA